MVSHMLRNVHFMYAGSHYGCHLKIFEILTVFHHMGQ